MHSNAYLLKRRNKLSIKHQCANKGIHRLQKDNLKINLKTKNEKERIREFYETIALGQSCLGIIVRKPMGTSINIIITTSMMMFMHACM